MGKSFQIAMVALSVIYFSMSTPALSDQFKNPLKKTYKTFQIVKNGKGEVFLRSTQKLDDKGQAQMFGPFVAKDIVSIRELDGEIIVENENTVVHAEFKDKYDEKLNTYNEYKNGKLVLVKDERGNWVSPEQMGIFNDNSHPLNFGKHLGKQEWKKILAKKPESLAAGCSEETWRKGYLEGLAGRKYVISVDSDQFNNLNVNSKDPGIQKISRMAPNNPERRACKGLESEQLRCCVQGFMSSIPELAKLIVKYKDHSEIKSDPELKRCFDEFGQGAQDGKTFCNAQFSCPHFNLDEPKAYLGCYTMAFAFTTMHSSCKKQVSNSLKAQFADYPIVAAAVEQTKLQFGEAYAPGCADPVKTASSAE
jgi:hypothetical protein